MEREIEIEGVIVRRPPIPKNMSKRAQRMCSDIINEMHTVRPEKVLRELVAWACAGAHGANNEATTADLEWEAIAEQAREENR